MIIIYNLPWYIIIIMGFMIKQEAFFSLGHTGISLEVPSRSQFQGFHEDTFCTQDLEINFIESIIDSLINDDTWID